MSSYLFRFVAVVTVLAGAGLLYSFAPMLISDATTESTVSVSGRDASSLCNLTGVVLDASKTAVAHASVCITGAAELAAVDAACASADDRGRYEFVGLKQGRYRLVATSGNVSSGAAVADLRTCDANVADVYVKTSPATLVGVVRDIEGHRVAASRVTVLGAMPESELRSTVLSDANGVFAIAVPPGQVLIEVQADNYATARMPAVVPNKDIVVTLIPDASITGKVVASDNKSPIKGLTIRAVPSGMLTEIFVPPVVSGEAGQFSIRGLEPGKYRLVAENSDWRSAEPTEVSVEIGKQLQGQIIEVSRGVPLVARVSVAVTDEPCPSGYVTLTDDHTQVKFPTRLAVRPSVAPAENPTTLSINSAIEDNGMVRFNGLAAGNYTAYVSCFGYLSSAAPSITIANETVAVQKWSVAPAARVLLTVRDASGHVIDDAQVGLLDAEDTLMTALSIGKGEYEIVGVSAGIYRVAARQNIAGNNSPPIQLTVPATSATVTATLVLAGDSSVFVKARNKSVGVSGLQVYASSQVEESGRIGSGAIIPATELGDGGYLIQTLAAGRYRISVGDGRNPPQSQEIELARGAKRDLEIEINFPGKITGSVTDDNGNALRGVAVSARHEGALPTWPLSTYQKVLKRIATLTDAHGQFVIEGLYPTGAYTVAVEKADSLAAKRMQVAAGSHVEFSLAAPVTLHGRVIDELNRPVAGAAVQITNEDTGVSLTESSSAMTGAWSFSNVAAGKTTIVARDSAGRMATLSFKATAQSSRDAVVLKLPTPEESNSRLTAF